MSMNVPMNVGSVGVGVGLQGRSGVVNKVLERTQAAG